MKVKLNKEQFDKLDDSAKKKTKLAVAVFDGEIELVDAPDVKIANPVCDVLYAAAVAVCNGIDDGIGKQVCLIAAKEAYKKCNG